MLTHNAEVAGSTEIGVNPILRFVSDIERYGRRYENRFYIALFCVLILSAWIPVLGTSFILDETGTYWTISGGAGEIVARATHFPQSILYCFLACTIASLSGASEVLLRLPSVLAGALSFWLLYRIGARLVDRSAGLMAALIWAFLPVTTETATLARPYMFGALVVIAAFLALLRWLESPTWARWTTWVVLTALPAYFSYFFSLILLHHLLYLCLRHARVREIAPKQLIWAPITIGLLELPLLPSFLAASATRAIHTYLAKPGPTVLVNELIPHAFAYAVIAGVCIHLLLPLSVRYRRCSSDCLFVAGSWAAIPIGILFTVSRISPTPVFVSRYVIAAFPGLALYLACLLRGFEPPSVRIAVIGIMAVFAATGFGQAPDFWRHKPYGDYRSASQYLSTLRRQTDLPLYAFSGFVEARFVPFPPSGYDRGSLLAPLIAYPVGQSVTLLPSAVHAGSRDFIDHFVADLNQKGSPFLVYAGNPSELPEWFTERVKSGFRETVLYNKEDVSVIEYTPRGFDDGEVSRRGF